MGVLGRASMWAIVVFDVFVVLFIISSSFKTTNQIFDNPWLPTTHPHFQNWATAWFGNGFGRATLNTVLVVGVSAGAAVAISAPAAYMLARTRSRLSNNLVAFMAVGIGIPDAVIVIPLFIMMSKVGLIDSLPGLCLTYTGLSIPFTVFLLTAFFRTLPSGVEEAAALDGAGTIRTFLQVMLPLARSGIVTALMLNVVGLWNETMIALVFLQDSQHFTLSLSLLAFKSNMQYIGQDYGGLFAGVCIVTLPIVVAYVFLGKRIIAGITIGADK
jgi:N-acetylglucosamine transport system permease protein